MGALTSRQNIGVEEVDISVNHAYRYPPKTGNYFSSHFIMGGERFDTAQPEMYLFGENMDLNFLGSRPAPFPYPAPSANEPSRTLKALVNIRKESLRFVRVSDDSLSLKEPENRTVSSLFNIEFTFDCDVRCAITIMYFCTEEVTNTGLVYTPRDPAMNSETYHYKRGANQQFSQVCHVFDPSKYPEENLLYSFDRDIMPIVIYCVAEEGEEPYQSHSTIAVVEKHSDGYSLKPLKQKLFVDGLCYLLQEIYGIENKNVDSKLAPDDDPDDNGAECVICMCDLRDTLILPCRHLCLCNCCADSLRYQANNCPICRAPFRALLQIKALQKIAAGAAGGATSNNEVKVARVPNFEGGVRGWSLSQQTHAYTVSNGESIPPGYEAVSLIEALNGPSVAPQQPTAPPYENMYVQLPQSATDGGLDGCLDDSTNSRVYQETTYGSSKSPGLEDSTTQTERPPSACDPSDIIAKGAATQMRMSVLMAQESEESIEMKSEGSSSSTPSSASKKKHKLKNSEESDVRNQETDISKDMTDGTVKKRNKTPTTTSPIGLTSASSSFSIKETSLCSNPADDTEELAETLSLLDDLKGEQKPSEIGISTSPVSTVSTEKLEKAEVADAPHSLPYDLTSVENGLNQQGMHRPFSGADGTTSNESGPNTQHNFQQGHISKSYEGQIGQDERVTSRDRSRKNKHKSSNSSNRRNRGVNSRGYNPTPNPENVATSEDPNCALPADSQSLPGTPLSHSSAVSRSSDASVSSASSTRALIISHPSQSSSTVI